MGQDVNPSLRIVGVGIGTFIIVAGFFLLLLIFFGGALFVKRPRKLYCSALAVYGTLLLFFSTARRRSEDDQITETDPMWIVRVLFGIILGSSSCIGAIKAISEAVQIEPPG